MIVDLFACDAAVCESAKNCVEEVFEHPPHNIPDYYQRTGNLMESLSATHITQHGNLFEFRVGWDSEYLSFRYPKGFGKSRYNGITGLQVLQAFDSGTHGYTVSGSHNYFQEALDELALKDKEIAKLGMRIEQV